MEVIAITFPAKRYHATPWDAHVNEGRIEWPPSPWRLLRALLAVGYNKLGWVDAPSEAAKSALLKLSQVNPVYVLPEATEVHTRHYMPNRDWARIKNKPAKIPATDKVFDSFLRFRNTDAELYVRFDLVLNGDERNALTELLQGLMYLGRAESWTEARLLSSNEIAEIPSSSAWCTANEQRAGRKVRLLTAMASNEFSSWRNECVTAAADALEQTERQKLEAKGKTLSSAATKKVRDKATVNYPHDLLSALQLETSTWQSQGWPQPPGSQWVDYCVPESLLDQQPLTPLAVSPRLEAFEAVLLAIDGEGKSGTVRPLMTRALPLMELLHSESIRKATKELHFGNLSELTGKSDNGTVLHGHQHAHWFPLSLYGQRRIDHVLVWRKNGFSGQSIATLSSIRWAYAKGIDRLSINLAGVGRVSEIATQLGIVPQCDPLGLMPLLQGCTWQSATPLVLRKFVHTHGKKTPEGQIREELVQRGFPEPIRIEIWSSSKMVEHHLKGYVVNRRQGKQQPPCAASWAATIEFPSPQQGPICLGYGSHFGLGLFSAIESQQR